MTALDYFKEITKIPHGSFHEKALSDWIYQFAQDLNLEVIQDEFNNLLIKKPASVGYEDAPTLMLQAHMDMVWEKNMGSEHDFENDPLKLLEKDGFLYADNTTLGADNGVGVAYIMAILADKNLKHPKLECVLTVEEEVGLTGASNFDTSLLSSELCIGLDSSGENKVTVSSAGAVRAQMVKHLIWEELESDTAIVEIRGLKGGHSGGDIHLERANSLRLAGTILKHAIEDGLGVRVVDLQGGSKVNAIPREANLEVSVNDYEAFATWFKTIEAKYKAQYETSDPNITFTLKKGKTNKVVDMKNTMGTANALFMLPLGALQRNIELDNLVTASGNIGIASVEGDTFTIEASFRSTQDFELENIMYRVKLISKNTGYDLEFMNRYPGWDYHPISRLRDLLKEVYYEFTSEGMEEEAVHGGLELGIWYGKMPHLDIIGMGPKMYDIHSPEEKLDIASFNRTFEILKLLLNSINNY